MTTLLVVLAALTAVIAAARSTWSPCGLSMLSSITPLAEQGRGHRYRTTACWFVVGSIAGGASLGLLTALLAAGLGAAGLSPTTLGTLALIACLAAAASDASSIKFRLPVHHRQVNERWLDQFRPWVYGTGFGWQIGAGLATYVKTSAVYLMIALTVLTGHPWLAVGVGALFGLVRGLAVILGRRITTPAALGGLPPALHGVGPPRPTSRRRLGARRRAARVARPVPLGSSRGGGHDRCLGRHPKDPRPPPAPHWVPQRVRHGHGAVTLRLDEGPLRLASTHRKR